MFDLFAPSHLLIIAIAVLVFVGPKDLPRLMHTVGKWTRKARGMAHDLRQGFEEIGSHEELKELREELAAMRAERPQDFEARPAAAPTCEVPAAESPEMAPQS